MNPCRLKIIVANINPDEKISDTESIKYVSKNIILNNNETDNLKLIPKQEEEKNMELQNEEDEEDIVIITDQNDLNKKKKIKISKEKVYLIDGLFSSTNMSTIKSNKKSNQNKETKKLRANKSININTNKKHNYSYKWENVHDNKVNTFYNSKVNQ